MLKTLPKNGTRAVKPVRTKLIPLKAVSTGQTGGSKKIKSLVTNVMKKGMGKAMASLKNVSMGKTGGAKKLASKVTSVKKDGGASSLPVGTNVKAKMSQGTPKAKLFRSPFNQ